MSRIALFTCLLCSLYNENSMNPPRYKTDVRQVKSARVLHLQSVGDLRYCFRSAWVVDYSWNVMAYGDAWKGKWRGNWRMAWLASTLHTTSEHGVSSITTVDAHTSAVSSRLNWRPSRFKLTRPFPRKTKSGFCACAITFQLASAISLTLINSSFCPHSCIYVFCLDLRTNSDYFPSQH